MRIIAHKSAKATVQTKDEEIDSNKKEVKADNTEAMSIMQGKKLKGILSNFNNLFKLR